MNQVNNKKVITVSLLGPSGVGKSTLTHFLIHGQFIVQNPTNGLNHSIYTLDDKKEFRIWDNPGVQRFRNNVLQMNKRSKAFIFVFDLSDGQSFSQINKWIQQLQDKLQIDKVIFYAFGNKSDLPRVIERDFIQNFWAQKGIQYNEISFVNNGNTKKVLDRVLSEIWYKMAYLESEQQKQLQSSFILNKPIENEKDKKAKRRCC